MALISTLMVLIVAFLIEVWIFYLSAEAVGYDVTWGRALGQLVVSMIASVFLFLILSAVGFGIESILSIFIG